MEDILGFDAGKSAPVEREGKRPLKLGEAVITATKAVFDTMIMMEAEAGPIQKDPLAFSCSVTGTLGLAGDLRGMLNVHCSEEAALAVTGNLLGMEIATIDEDVRDAVGEITNMIAGGVKTALAQEGKSLELAIPTTVAGRSYQVNCVSGSDRILVPFRLPAGAFWVELKFMLN